MDIAGSSSCRWNRIEHIAISRSRASLSRRSGSAFAGILGWGIGKNPPIVVGVWAENRSLLCEPLSVATFE